LANKEDQNGVKDLASVKTGPIPAHLPDYPTLIHALADAAARVPDKTAMICMDKSLTYGEYARAVAGMARHLQGFHIQGQRAAVMLGNSIEASVASVGTMAAGAQAVLTNPAYTESELTPLLADADPAAIICDADAAEKARSLAAHLAIPHVVVLGEDDQSIAEWAGDPDLNLPESLPGPDDLAAMFFTGGTTGIPKGANHTHSMLITFCRQIAALLEYEFDTERMLSVAPMFHIFGHHYANLLPLYLRALIVIVPRYKPEIVLEQLEKHKITVFSGGPAAIYVGLLGNERMAETDFSALKYSLSGGSACPEYLINTWQEKTNSIFLEGFGMSEGAPIANNPARGTRKVLSVGVAPPETEIDIVDLEDGITIMPVGERGELRVKGPQIMTGYCNRPEETAQALRDGWLYTGDIGYLDEEGYLFIVDRKKDMILVGGFNVYPREIDELLHSHPAIYEAAAIGVSDDFRGEVVKAYVVLQPGESLGEEEVIEYCKQHLADYKVPHFVEFVDSLPKTGANKINKRLLKSQSENK